ncbi:TPA: DUF2971 domain-containing protein [Aeromonas hydrophila]
MNTLYKYYSSYFDISEHIGSPSIKLAHVNSFNDPFETQIAHVHAESLAKISMELSNETGSASKHELIQSYKKLNSYFGVVSLTETHRNILMWSHYASSHKGVCVGYNKDFLEAQASKKAKYSNEEDILNYKPQRVIYDSKRFDLEQQESNTLKSVLHAMRKKSDEWIYEKEHRCIVPFTWADKIKVSSPISKEATEIIEEALAESIIKNGKSENEFILNKINKFDIHRFTNNENFTAFKEINIKSINSIYLGGRFGHEKTCKMKQLIDSKPNLYGHIRLYKYEINENNFSLDIIPLSNVPLLTELDSITKDRILNYCL